MEKQNPIEEAERYVDNAKLTLKTNGELDTETRLYGDKKYVRAAGHYLWNAVLIALDAVFEVETRHGTSLQGLIPSRFFRCIPCRRLFSPLIYTFHV